MPSLKNSAATHCARFAVITKVTWSKSKTSSPLPQISDNKNIALIGFMAVGKSAVGRKLARRLKKSFVELDRLVEKKEGKKIRTIFEEKGETHFRKLESEALCEVLRENRQVIATGGGVVTDQK